MVKRNKKILIKSKGFKKSNLYKLAKQKYIKKLLNQYKSRKLKKRKYRSRWIFLLNNFLKNLNLRYSLFISSLKKQKIALNRKISYLIIVNDII